jgi:hypothetical protein
MSFSWDNDSRMDGFVLLLTDEQQTSQDKQRKTHLASDPARTRFVVLLPQPILATGNIALEIEDLLPATKLQELRTSGKVTDIIYYD